MSSLPQFKHCRGSSGKLSAAIRVARIEKKLKALIINIRVLLQSIELLEANRPAGVGHQLLIYYNYIYFGAKMIFNTATCIINSKCVDGTETDTALANIVAECLRMSSVAEKVRCSLMCARVKNLYTISMRIHTHHNGVIPE